ncbi:hypothetical protein [Abyssisolibacter fermentans]|uniref:hypothetical protein n=1 Tax=Abyssisolibacter fermentans TaxID=1766203 RepID=UPI000833D97A|nr:hypothetical protein [Abyssisolibacter fermentans]
MRSRFIRICTLLICIILLISCRSIENSGNTFEQRFDENDNYIGFKDISSEYTLEDAKKDEYYVELDSKVYANYNLWEEFIELSSSGENAFIRIIHFYSNEDSNSPYFLDLYYNDDYYYLFDSSADELKKEKFLFLVTLEGKYGSPLKDTSITILTNNNMMTFDEFTKAMVSSDLKVLQSIMPYRMLMFE